MAHAGGRPTKYKEEYCKRMVDYFRVEAFVMKTKESYYADGALKSKEEYPVANTLPTFEGFADDLDVNVDTLMDWTRKHAEFFRAYARAKALQKKMVLINGTNKLFDPQFTKFMAINNLGMTDRTELETHNINENRSLDKDDPKELERLMKKHNMYVIECGKKPG